jgi:hypothetical protein
MNQDELNPSFQLLGMKAPEIRVGSDRFSPMEQRREFNRM